MISAMNSFIGQIMGNIAALFTDSQVVRASYRASEDDGFINVPTTTITPTNTPFKIICYNVLGPKHGVSSKHNYSPLHDREWNVRRDRLFHEIDGYDADIVCLQELTSNTYRKDFEPHMTAQGYQSAFKMKFRRESLPKMLDTEMILAPGTFIRTSRFEVLELRTCLISSHLSDVERYLSTELPKKFRDHVMEKNNSMQLCLLKDKLAPNGKQIVLVNAHLHWDPNEMDIKAIQAVALQVAVCEFLKEKKLTREQVAVVICGDFNSMEQHQRQFCINASEEQSAQTKNGGVFEYMRTGKLKMNHPEHPASFRHVHHVPDLTSPLGPFIPTDHVSDDTKYVSTTKTDTFAGRIDYIWIDDSVAVSQVLPMPFNRDTLRSFAPIPNTQYASDHLALGASVAIKL